MCLYVCVYMCAFLYTLHPEGLLHYINQFRTNIYLDLYKYYTVDHLWYKAALYLCGCVQQPEGLTVETPFSIPTNSLSESI